MFRKLDLKNLFNKFIFFKLKTQTQCIICKLLTIDYCGGGGEGSGDGLNIFGVSKLPKFSKNTLIKKKVKFPNKKSK